MSHSPGMYRPYQAFSIDCSGDTRTKQSFKESCDINLIVKRHGQTGMWDHLNPIEPHYGDFSQAVELQEAIQLVNDADEAFMALPAAVRESVGNDPVQMMNALAEPDGFRDLVEAGMPSDTEPEPAPETDPETTGPETPIQGGN